MPTPKLPDETCLETLRLYHYHGMARLAAGACGINPHTFEARLSVARKRFPGWRPEQPAAYTAPDLPSEDEDLDALIARLAAERERQATARAAADWMRFTVADPEPFALAFIGDPHIDTCDIGLLKSHVELIEQTPRMWAVGLGDWINGWVGKLRGQYAFQSATERDAYRLAQWVLQKPIWWLLIWGNHDGARWHGEGSPLKWMEKAAPITSEWQAKFSIGCGDATWKVWAAHNFPGNSQFNANHGLDKRALHTGAIADLFVAGDRHTFKLSQDQHAETGRMFWSARARGYKPLDHYALEKGYSEQTMGHSIGAVFDPRTGKLTCFADLEEAAAYLTFLRLRQVRGREAA